LNFGTLYPPPLHKHTNTSQISISLSLIYEVIELFEIHLFKFNIPWLGSFGRSPQSAGGTSGGERYHRQFSDHHQS
jgi:hypothetical protein